MTDTAKSEWCEGERQEVPRSELECDKNHEIYHDSQDRPPHYLNGVPVDPDLLDTARPSRTPPKRIRVDVPPAAPRDR